MKLQWPCPSCGTMFRVDEKFAGRKTRCPACDAEILVPAASAADKVEPARAAAPRKALPIAAPVAPKAAPKPQVAKIATPVETDDADVFAFTKSSPAKPTVSLAAKSKPKSKSQWENPTTWITLGFVGVVVVLVAVILYVVGQKGEDEIAGPKPPPKKPEATKLVLEWPSDAVGVIVEIDGAKQRYPDKGEIAYTLDAGKDHEIVLTRMGFPPYKETYDPGKTPGKHVVRPPWSAGGPGPSVANNSPGGNVVSTSVPALKKWVIDPSAAKQEAAKSKKDVLLIFFTEEHRDDWCFNLANNVFTKPEFADYMNKHLVPVLFETDQKAPPSGTSMAKSAEEYRITSFPALVLIDDHGQVLCRDKAFVGRSLFETLNWMNGVRAERDRVFAAAENGSDADKLAHAREALTWLREKGLTSFYAPQIHIWEELAEKADPKNEKGEWETFVIAEAKSRLDELAGGEKPPVTDIAAAVEPLQEWLKKGNKVKKDLNAAAEVYLKAAAMVIAIKQEDPDLDALATYVQQGLALNPTKPEIVIGLKGIDANLHRPTSNGTGWVCAPGGYFMTNHHVIDGKEKIWIQFGADEHQRYPAKLIADSKDPDMALIRFEDPGLADKLKLKPLPICPTLANPGTDVGAFGFPLVMSVGFDLKFTHGSISALPTKERDNMYALDLLINPGNSGGPLVSKRGQVFGINTAKSVPRGPSEQSYGLAVSSDSILKFLKQNLPNFKPETGEKLPKVEDWSDLYPKVSPSVVIILRTRS